MAHNNHVIDGWNKNIGDGWTRESYLELTENFQSKLKTIYMQHVDGFNVAREDCLGKGGTKARAAEFLMSQVEQDEVVYCMPRVGHAACAVIRLASLYNKDVTLFAPACKKISEHQAAAIDYANDLNVKLDVKFRRIAAMPNLNRMAASYAQDKSARFLPFGLNSPYTIAGFVRICQNMMDLGFPEPEEIWTVVSTGVLTRGLQIGFPNAEMRGVCVARNMKAGELGRTKVWSDPKAFTQKESPENLPPFDTVPTYDGKGWKFMKKYGKPGALFWNVAGALKAPKDFDYSSVDSYRDWNEIRD